MPFKVVFLCSQQGSSGPVSTSSSWLLFDAIRSDAVVSSRRMPTRRTSCRNRPATGDNPASRKRCSIHLAARASPGVPVPRPSISSSDRARTSSSIASPLMRWSGVGATVGEQARVAANNETQKVARMAPGEGVGGRYQPLYPRAVARPARRG